MKNIESRRQVAWQLIGRKVVVKQLGEEKPQDVPNVDLYVPLPEYGIALWTYLEEDQSLDRLVNG